MKQYIALFEYEDVKDGFGVVFPDLPGCTSAGDNYEDAVRMAHEAIALYADGEVNIPDPRTLEEIKETWKDWKEWEKNYKFMVGYVTLIPLQSTAKRINITIDEALLVNIDKVTKNRSAFLADAARRMLGIVV